MTESLQSFGEEPEAEPLHLANAPRTIGGFPVAEARLSDNQDDLTEVTEPEPAGTPETAAQFTQRMREAIGGLKPSKDRHIHGNNYKK